MRTPERNMGHMSRWRERWARWATGRNHLGEYNNCKHPHIPLPPGKEKIEIIFIMPPDPLHFIVLGKFNKKVML